VHAPFPQQWIQSRAPQSVSLRAINTEPRSLWYFGQLSTLEMHCLVAWAIPLPKITKQHLQRSLVRVHCSKANQALINKMSR
jgi:hypothetical protein